MKSNPRQIAVEVLNQVEKGGFAEPLIDRALSRPGFVNASDRRLLTQLVYGTLRMQGRLDWRLAKLCRGRLEKMSPGLRNILRTGLFQILFMDRIPDHAAVNQSAALAGRMFPGRVGLVNAVLRNAIRLAGESDFPDPEREPARHISVVHSHPLWLVEEWIGLFGVEETLALCRADNEIPPACLRVNRLKGSRESLRYLLEREAANESANKSVDDLEDVAQEARGKTEPRAAPATTPATTVEETRFSPDGLVVSHPALPLRELELFRQGRFQIQDEASQLIGLIPDAQPGEEVLDACCGIGGKASHLAERMVNRGTLLALDIHPGKLEGLRALTRRLGIGIIKTFEADATEELGADFHGRFHRILIDAPCSGLGTLRRNPEIKWRLRPGDLEGCSGLQREILNRVANYLKRGGILVYSTCSVMPQENEEVVRAFLAVRPDFRPAPMPAGIAPALIDGAGWFRSRPDRHGMDGFFAARLERI